MLKVGNQAYINLDNELPLSTLPNINDAIAESYQLIKQNTWQQTINLAGEQSQCNWLHKNKDLSTPSDFFKLELKNKTLAPMWILELTTTPNNELNLYDSISTPAEDWERISFRTDLPESWNEMVLWIKNLNCFSKIGRTSLLIARPGIPVQYHRDIGVSGENFEHYDHRQEFIWINLSHGKTLYILDQHNNPTLVDCSSAFFNHHNWHGSHETLQQWCFSFKIEGIFSEKFRKSAGLSEALYSKNFA